MRGSRRLKRMSRNRVKITKMNLTSLMDVFTILVFFLLVNSGSVEVMEAPKTITLPESNAQLKPRETVVIQVTADEVLVQGKKVASVENILEGVAESTDGIKARLAELNEYVIGPSTKAVSTAREITILADKSVPFTVVKTVMSTCTSEGYENVSLAVLQKATRVAAN